jgi:hypothetical protein
VSPEDAVEELLAATRSATTTERAQAQKSVATLPDLPPAEPIDAREQSTPGAAGRSWDEFPRDAAR